MREPEDWTFDDADLRRSGEPRFGVVRAVVVDGDYAIVLDDLNSDYREVALIGYHRVGRRWREIFHQDDAGFPTVGDTHPGGWSGGYGWTFGREDPDAAVQLRYQGEPVEVVADAEGWWMCVRETTGQQVDVPERVY